jgi:hypothetical protein
VLIIVGLSAEAVADPPTLARLENLARTHELVLTCTHRAVGAGVLPVLRRALPGRQIVALFVDDPVAPYERELVLEILEEGRLPLIFTTQETSGWVDWLDADANIALTTDPAPSNADIR